MVSYSVLPTPEHNLTILALATIPNPVPSTHVSIPQLPFLVSLLHPPLEPLPIAKGFVSPTLTPAHINLPINGSIVAVTLCPSNSQILSDFLSSFLSGIAPSILISSPLMPSLTLQTTFPPPNPPPKVLRDVEIKNMVMHIAPDGKTMLASGQVWARLVLPRGVNVPVNATHVWPDLLVYDGEVEPPVPDPTPTAGVSELELPPWIPHPDPGLPKLPHPTKLPGIHLPHILPIPSFPFPWHGGGGGQGRGRDPDDPAPLPDPLPDRAFARIRPDEWLIAKTLPNDSEEDPADIEEEGWIIVDYEDGEEEGWSAVVTADIHNVPLQILPGRDGQFRSFLSKVNALSFYLKACIIYPIHLQGGTLQARRFSRDQRNGLGQSKSTRTACTASARRRATASATPWRST